MCKMGRGAGVGVVRSDFVVVELRISLHMCVCCWVLWEVIVSKGGD